MLRWLHISDLHIKKKADWTNFKTELFRKCKEIGKINFVIVTGDFHDFSEGESFEKAEEFLQSLMDELCLNIEKDLFLIPGNHDGTSDIKFRGTCIKAAKGDPLNFEPDCLEQLLSMFGNYDNFVKKLIANYPVDQPSAVHLRVWNHQLALIHCNTALAADGGEKEDQILDIDGLSEIKVSPGLPIFLLAHNSFYDLNEQQQDRVKDYIRNNNVCAYLCGDTHVDDVRQISFGLNQNEQIPCIISYKSAPDPKDSYSRFGMIIGEWEKEYAELKGWIWLSGEGFKPDGTIYEKKINMRGLPVPSAVPSIDCDVQFSEEWKLIDKSVEEQKSKNLNNRMKQFLRGFPCTWALAFSDLPVARKQFDSLKLKIQEGGIIALLGAGAEGKSTLLMQLSAQLYREGHVVLFYIKKVGRRKYQLPEQLPDNAVLVVDDPDDYNFIKLVYQVYEDGYTLLFAARHNEWNLLCDRYDVSADMNRMITFEYMNNVTDPEEAGAFADRVMQYYRPDADRDEMIEIFLHNSGEYGFLYAAMLLAIYDKEKFEEIAKDIIKYIGDNNPKYLQLLGYAVLSEQAGAFFTEYQYQSLLKRLSLKFRDAKSALELELQHKKGRWETRHPQISRLFYAIIFNENGYFENADIDGMKYDLLDVALNEYTKNGPSIVKKSLMENMISLASFMDEVQEPQPMIQRVVEELRNNIIVLQKISAQILKEETYCAFAEKCYSAHVIDFSIMLRWAKSQQTLQGAGDYGQENSALWIYQEACMNQKKMGSSVWLGWAQLEKETHGVGEYTKENSALWIYREACINRKVSGSDIWLGWAKLQKEAHGAGDYGQKNSALWIYREACMNQRQDDPSIWLAWAQLEEEAYGAGNYGKENSALWIYCEACMNHRQEDSTVWLGWAQLEKETHGVRDYTKENSALWIYREACINRKVSGKDIWLGWAKLEEEAHGVGDYEKENSALWLYRESCITRKLMVSGIWLGWAKLEKEAHGAGDYGKENSALWVYREACINRKVSGSDIWLGWVQLEREAHGVGDYGKENSALWLYREACINRKVSGSDIWLGWAKLEKEVRGAGDYEKENSALWIYREACINRKVPGSDIWLGWVKLEKEAHGAGDYGQENSALWIYHEACINQNFTGSDIWLSWAKDCVLNREGEWTKLRILKHALNVTHREVQIVSEYGNYLMHNNYFEEARKEYRKESNKNYILSSLLIIEMVAGNISGQDEFSTTVLIPRIKSAVAYSNAARYSLYLYYQFMGDKEEADVYYAMLDLVLDEVKNIAKRLDDFLNDCLRAHQHPAAFV